MLNRLTFTTVMKKMFQVLALIAAFASVHAIDQTLGIAEPTKAFKGELFQVPAEITELEVNRDDYEGEVWYGVYTPNTPGGFVNFMQSDDGTLTSLRIVVNDQTVYEWSSKPGQSEPNRIKIELDDWKAFFKKDVLSRMK